MANGDLVEKQEELAHIVYTLTESLETLSSDLDETFGKIEEHCNELDGIKNEVLDLLQTLREWGWVKDVLKTPTPVVNEDDEDSDDDIDDAEADRMYARMLAERDD